jgi:hypothetical protein
MIVRRIRLETGPILLMIVASVGCDATQLTTRKSTRSAARTVMSDNR